jgi:uncharacterized membrane protein YfcA
MKITSINAASTFHCDPEEFEDGVVLNKIITSESQTIPIVKVLIIFSLLFVIILLNLAKGG